MGFIKQHVAECLLANRARRRLSREELARRSGIPAPTLQNYEDAKTTISLENAWRIADVYGMDLDDLFERQHIDHLASKQ